MDWTAGFLFPAGVRDFSFLNCVQIGFEVHPAIYAMGIGVVSLGIKRAKREADHSLLSSAEVKNGGDNLHSLIRLHGVMLN
jgi:hypothetical protein